MKKLKGNRLNVGFAILLMLFLLISSAPVYAWGPERPTYTMENPAKKPVLNSIIDNSGVGDERDFVRIAERGAGILCSDLEIEAGKDYLVYIYYHNNASATYNDKTHNYSGVAVNVRLTTNFPHELKAGEIGTVFGRLSSDNTDLAEVWDEAYIRAKEDVTIYYIENSAQLHNSWAMNNAILPTEIFSNEGSPIGLNALNGVILGCDEYAGNITYVIRVVAKNDSDTQVTDGIKVVINGQPLILPQPAYTDNGSTMVPMRAIFEALGADVNYDGGSQKITAAKADITIELVIGNKIAVKNGQSITLDAAAVTQNGNTMVPLRFVAESLQAQVDWDNATQTVSIATK